MSLDHHWRFQYKQGVGRIELAQIALVGTSQPSEAKKKELIAQSNYGLKARKKPSRSHSSSVGDVDLELSS